MSETPAEPVQKKTLAELALERKQVYLAEKQAKQATKVAKPVNTVKKDMKRASITIIQDTNKPSVHIENLPKVTPEDVQELIQTIIGTKNTSVSRQGKTWSVSNLSPQKQAQLVQKLHGNFCKESSKNLKVYIK